LGGDSVTTCRDGECRSANSDRHGTHHDEGDDSNDISGPSHSRCLAVCAQKAMYSPGEWSWGAAGGDDVGTQKYGHPV